MRIRSGDTVVIRKGKDRGKQGKVLQASHRQKKVIVEGLNKMTKHMRPQQRGAAGERLEIESPITVANVMLVCPKCSKPSRVGYTFLDDGTKKRQCKKCQAEV